MIIIVTAKTCVGYVCHLKENPNLIDDEIFRILFEIYVTKVSGGISFDLFVFVSNHSPNKFYSFQQNN
jgi:hypothetical protein